MSDFAFYHPIEIRYGDLDPQGHVNNASYLTYFEQARIHYVAALGLWQSGDFQQIGIILAEARISFRQPVLFQHKVRVGVRVTRLGNKSLEMIYRLEDSSNGQTLAEGATVLVTYDYPTHTTIPIPQAWRTAISTLEHIPPMAETPKGTP